MREMGVEVADSNDGPKWQVVAEPVGANPGLKPKTATGKALGRKRVTGANDQKGKDNVGGVVVYVQLGRHRKEEVARVGWMRKASENPKDTFEAKLNEVLDVAQKTADTLNSLTPDGELL